VAFTFTVSDDGKDTSRGTSTHAIRKAIGRAGLNAPDLVKRYGRTPSGTPTPPGWSSGV
jgi:hypothetical protein